jgi:S-(hydroxymethyl)glutathione dehydrogenase/alcohol dehydrogenase
MLSAFSQFIVIPEESAVPVNKEARFDRICLLGCALTAGFGSVSRTANVEAGATTALWGFGGIGSGVLNGLKQTGAGMIIVVEPLEWKEAPARKMGATHFINPTKEDPVEKIMKLTNGIGVDYAFECWGGWDCSTQAQAYNSLRNRGTAIFLGAPDASLNSIPINGFSFCITEKIIKGSLYGSVVPLLDVPKFVDLYLTGKLDLDTVVTKMFKLEDINKGFDAMRNGEVIRGVLSFD